MAEEKEEWEIGYSQVHPPVEEVNATNVDLPIVDEMVGQMLDGRFLIEKDLTEGGADEGGIGLVYLAKDMKLMGKETVVKILKKESLKNEDIGRKFLHEKEALIRLDHPNIVRILDFGTLSDGNPFMVMEFIPGHSLRKVLNEHAELSFSYCAHIIRKVADGLSAAHSEKILHRDIKPENIMITPQEEGLDRVRLIDFGIARVEESKLAPQTEVQRGIGTILYMAPEQLSGNLEQTPAVDIYAFAIVIYEMLTGRKPFQPKSLVEMFQLQQEGLKRLPGEFRNDLSEEAEQILISAFSFEAEKRPQNARQFGLDLARALDGNITSPNEPITHSIAGGLDKTKPSPAVRTDETIDPPGAGNITVAPTEPSIKENYSLPNLPDVTHQPVSKKGRLIAWAGLVAILLTAVLGIAGFVYWQSNAAEKAENENKVLKADENNTDTGNRTGADDSNANGNLNTATDNPIAADPEKGAPMRQMAFYLMVQKMRDGKPYEEPFRSSGLEIFETGYKFQLLFEKVPAGYFYLFNEGVNAEGINNYNILFPTPVRNNGSAQIAKDQNIETGNNTFAETRGTEFVWVIWTAEKRDDLELVLRDAFAGDGKVKDPEKAKLLAEFVAKNNTESTRAEKNSENQITVLSGKGDVVVYKIKLEHR